MPTHCRFQLLLVALLAACSSTRDDDNGNPVKPPTKPTPAATCGNGVINGLEPCDGAAIAGSAQCATYGLGTGKVSCTPTCGLSFATCSFGDYCTANNLYSNQQCDNCELLGGVADPECMSTCGADGMCKDRFDPLTGNWTCKRRGFTDPDCGMCGNAIIEGAEVCDGQTFRPGKNRCQDWGYEDGSMGCNNCLPVFTACRASQCGDTTIEGLEVCEGTNLAGASCESLGFAAGALTCTSTCGFSLGGCVAPGCGNNIVEAGLGETCEAGNLGGATCQAQGFSGGTLGCSAACRLDTSACIAPGCNNGIIDPPLEQCEAGNLNGATCMSQGFLAGALNCSTTSCTFDTSMCVAPGCGNGIVEAGTEQCEGTNLNGGTCQSQGFVGGTLVCEQFGCNFDTSGCIAAGCGNGIIESPVEQCEGTNLNGATCVSRGYATGTLSCSGCQFVETACIAAGCNNGILETGEQCEGTNFNGATCMSQGFASGNLNCNATCQIDTTSCVGSNTAGCGDGVVRGLEACDTINSNYPMSCASWDLGSGNALCNSQCRVDFSFCSGGDFCMTNNYYNDGLCDPCEALGGSLDPDCSGCGANGVCVSYFDGLGGDYTCTQATGSPDPDCGCGDGNLEPVAPDGSFPEMCEGNQFVTGRDTCAAWGFTMGNLACSAACKPLFAGCVP